MQIISSTKAVARAMRVCDMRQTVGGGKGIARNSIQGHTVPSRILEPSRAAARSGGYPFKFHTVFLKLVLCAGRKCVEPIAITGESSETLQK